MKTDIIVLVVVIRKALELVIDVVRLITVLVGLVSPVFINTRKYKTNLFAE